jgi:hypothetical protein
MSQSKQDMIGGVPAALWLTPSVFTRIKETIGARKAESGGMLGGDRETGEVTEFYFDDAALEQSAGTYRPNHTLLTRVLKEEWKPNRKDLLGFIHSHPPYYNHPSPWDKEYAKTILEHMELPYLLLPIIRTAADAGAFAMFPYLAKRTGDGIDIIEQRLRVGEEIVPIENQMQEDSGIDLRILEILTDVGLAAIDLTVLIAAGFTTAQLVRTLRRYQQKNRRRKRP